MHGSRLAKGFTEMRGNVKIVVDVVVAKVVGNIRGRHFRAPNFGRRGDGVAGGVGKSHLGSIATGWDRGR